MSKPWNDRQWARPTLKKFCNFFFVVDVSKSIGKRDRQELGQIRKNKGEFVDASEKILIRIKEFRTSGNWDISKWGPVNNLS